MDRINLRFSELLISRLCHELVGAAGAIGNGIEYLEEHSEQIADTEVVSLLSNSSVQLTSRLKFYRVAYGFAGNAIDNIAELRSLAFRFYDADPDVSLTWQMAPIAPDLSAGEGRLILNVILLARQSIGLAGDINVSLDDDQIVISGVGDGVKENGEFVSISSGEKAIDDLSAKNVHEFLTCQLAAQLGMKISQSVGMAEKTPQILFCIQKS
ncbi:histidine phosphotransferase family protein [Curvivirga sp.]|uniref:histidine phosphotransferase family protein n=1 Tax=Curvivirga sp. TaxID=2856848 RepID=UPI003B5A1EE1